MVLMAAGEDWRRLGEYIRNRRKALDISRTQMASLTGISYRTIGQVERSSPVAPDTLAAIENVLRWKPGSSRRVLSGGDPVLEGEEDRDPVADEQLRYLTEHFPSLSDGERRGIVALIEGMRAGGERRTGS
jgi:transcriptional regulator with XRE-family HTH domain